MAQFVSLWCIEYTDCNSCPAAVEQVRPLVSVTQVTLQNGRQLCNATFGMTPSGH